jgi:hypothetical protein
MLEINPELTTQETILLIRQAIRVRDAASGDFSGLEVIDEALALELAAKSVHKKSAENRVG